MKFPHWYAAYTRSRAEKIVAQHLGAHNIETYLPLYSKISQWRNGQKMKVDLPLFPGYVFVKVRAVDRLDVLETPGVVHLCGNGGTPICVGDDEIEILRAGLKQIAAEPYPFLAVGERVRVRSGALAGLEGFLARKKDSLRFVLSMDLMMQAMSVEVDANDLEPVTYRSRIGFDPAVQRNTN